MLFTINFIQLHPMLHWKNWWKASTPHARMARWKKHNNFDNFNNDTDGIDTGSNIDECGWDSTINHFSHSDNKDDMSDLSDEWEDTNGNEGDQEELEGEDLVESLHHGLKNELVVLEECQRGLNSELKMAQLTKQEWRDAEKKQGFRCTGNSLWTKQCHAQAAQKKESKDAVLWKRCVTKPNSICGEY